MVTRWNYPSVSRFTLGLAKTGVSIFQYSAFISGVGDEYKKIRRPRASLNWEERNGRSLSLCSLSDYRTRGPAMTDTTRQAARERLWFGGQ